MTSPYLPDDCIYNILKYLRNFRSTLFNCLLVNRFWCKATVPMLYADPFYYISHTYNEKVILTLILCFDKAEILQLKNQLKLINIKSSNININDKDKPLFQYPRYLENFHYTSVNYLISEWLNCSYYELCQNFIPIFHQSILRQCNNIKQLGISLFDETYKHCNIQTFTSNLTRLNSLTLHLHSDVKNDDEFLNNLSNTCLNLRELEFFSSQYYPTYVDNIIKEKLCSIIQKQNNLKVIKLSLYVQSFLNDILSSLEFQKNSLINIEFNSINFSNISFDGFINLYNLKYLKFNYCNGTISSNQYEILKYVSFKLIRLEFKCNKWDNNLVIPLIIKYLGTSLQELILINELSISIIENILAHCLNLITLEIKIGSNIDSSVFSYFKNLKIRILNVNNNCGTDKIFKNLANNLPNSVKEVSLYSYSLSHLEIFLENCHDCLEIINLNYPIRFIGLKLQTILNYIERSNNGLKFLGMTKLEKVSNEELKLLNQIKINGVKVVDFYKYDYS